MPARKPLSRLILLLSLILVPAAARGASFIVPHDDDLIRDADAIVIATVRDMYPRFATNRDIVTTIEFDVEEVLKPHPDLELPLHLVELGGIIGEQFMVASGSPVYWSSNRALLFLQRDSAGNWRTYGLSLGKFDFVEDDKGHRLAVRWAQERDIPAFTKEGQPSEEPLRDADRFLAYIRAQQRLRDTGPRMAVQSAPAATSIANPEYVVTGVAPEELQSPLPQVGNAVFPPSAYLQGNFRWNIFSTGGFASFFVSGSQPGYDSTGAAQRGLAAWTNDPGSNVDYRFAGTNSARFVQDGVNTILYNSATDVPAGAIAYAKWYGSGQHTYKTETFYSTNEGDVVVKAGLSVSQKVFDEAVTHELGHTLGFRHSDQGTPSSVEAVMKATVSGNYGATLGPWDIEAVRTVYEGATAADPPPTFTFTDDPLQPGVTRIKAIHFTELRNAVNTFRAYAKLAPVTWSENIVPGVTVKAIHINELRNALAPALTAVGRSATFAEAVTTGTIIKASHVQELRNKMK